MNMKVLEFLGAILFSIILFSCGHKNHAHSVDEPQYHIQPRADSAASDYYYTVRSESHSEYTVNDKKLVSGSTTEMGMHMTLAKDSGDGMLVHITYDKLHVIMDNRGEHMDVTARQGDSSADPVERMLGNVLGSVLTVQLDSLGTVRKISGDKDISAKIFGALGGADPTVKVVVENQLGKLFGPDFAKNTLQQIFKLVPDSITHVGDSWSMDQVPEGVKMHISHTYTLASVDGGIASVDGTSKIESNGDNSITFMDQQFPATITGKEESHYKVDVHSGILLQGHSVFSMKGQLSVMGKDVPIIFKSEKSIEGKKS
jgi:hypothetical protein